MDDGMKKKQTLKKLDDQARVEPNLSTALKDEPAPAVAEPAAEAVQPPPAPAQPAAAPAQSAPPASGVQAEMASLQGQFAKLSGAVLDAAEVANRSAEVANRISTSFESQMTQLSAAAFTTRKINTILIGVTAGLMLIALVIFAIFSARLSNRVNELDEMLLAVGKRTVELNAGIAALESLTAHTKDLSARQGAMVDVQAQVESKISDALKKSESLMQTMPNRAAQQITQASANLTREVQSINSKLQQQSKAVQTLGDEVKSLKSDMNNVNALKRDVNALVVLQKDRVLEQLQKPSAQAPAPVPAPKPKDSPLQFPRPKPAD
jgi:methyl-accepting chemotaxis protein